MSADTIVPGFANPQALNRYSYVMNNPMRYTDPTGHWVDEGCGTGGSGSPGQGTGCDLPMPSPINGGGGGSGGSGGGGSDHDDDELPGHDYETMSLVCLAVFTCSEQEVDNYATMFQYPGQWPWGPVANGQHYDVFPATLWGVPNPVLWILGMGDSGAITVDISNHGSTLTNQTEPTHIFHNGQVVRTSHQGVDGDSNWYVTTHGTGTNDTPHYGPLIDQANDTIGPVMFQMMNAEMLVYTTLDQLPGFFLEQASSLLH